MEDDENFIIAKGIEIDLDDNINLEEIIQYHIKEAKHKLVEFIVENMDKIPFNVKMWKCPSTIADREATRINVTLCIRKPKKEKIDA